MSSKKILFIFPESLPKKNVIGDNTGNYVYYLAVYSYFFGMQNVICLCIDEIQKHLVEDEEWGKRNFDIAVMAEANLFAYLYL